MEHTFQIIHQIDLMLERAENGLMMARFGNYNQGMYDCVIHGRSVTFVLQNLRKTESDFDEWYIPFQEQMKNDEMLKFFVELRTKMSKQGISPINIEVGLEESNLKKISKLSRPKNARKTVLSSDGNSYHEVKKPDGSIEKIPIEAKFDVHISQRFQDAPKTHLGENIEGETALRMAERYVKYLIHLASETHRRFDKMRACDIRFSCHVYEHAKDYYNDYRGWWEPRYHTLFSSF